MRVWLQIQGSRVRSRPGPILSWRLIMKSFLRSFSSLPLIYSRRVIVSYKRKYVHKLLVNRLFKPAQEKVWLSELTVPQWPYCIAVDLGRKATKQTKHWLITRLFIQNLFWVSTFKVTQQRTKQTTFFVMAGWGLNQSIFTYCKSCIRTSLILVPISFL